MQGDVVTQLVSVVLNLGLPGVIIVALVWTIRGLYQENTALRQQVFDIGILNAKALEANTAALTRLTDNLVKGGKT